MKFPFEMAESADFDVVGFGTNAVDHLIEVANYPAFNSKVEFLAHSRAAGGEVAMTLVGLQRLGFRTAYAGRFGDDQDGEFGLESLECEGIDTTYCEQTTGASTQTAFIIIERATGERTILWNRDKKLAYAAYDAPIAAAARCRILHLTAHDVRACIRMATAARGASAVVSLDIDNFADGVEDLLPLVNVLIASSDLPVKLTAKVDQAAALRGIHDRYGCQVVGVTLGSDGSLFYCDGEFIETPGFAVPGGCRDTTGAGDAFRTGFLYGMLTGTDVPKAAKIANATAALKCRMPGARAGLPNLAELTALINEGA